MAKMAYFLRTSRFLANKNTPRSMRSACEALAPLGELCVCYEERISESGERREKGERGERERREKEESNIKHKRHDEHPGWLCANTSREIISEAGVMYEMVKRYEKDLLLGTYHEHNGTIREARRHSHLAAATNCAL